MANNIRNININEVTTDHLVVIKDDKIIKFVLLHDGTYWVIQGLDIYQYNELYSLLSKLKSSFPHMWDKYTFEIYKKEK